MFCNMDLLLMATEDIWEFIKCVKLDKDLMAVFLGYDDFKRAFFNVKVTFSHYWPNMQAFITESMKHFTAYEKLVKAHISPTAIQKADDVGVQFWMSPLINKDTYKPLRDIILLAVH
jgi:hypothetical protein